ncbi:MAG: 30S ribosome-binding factor RbfA [Verrucomicrobiales bacterium]
MSQRMLRVRELMKRELSSVIQRDYEFKDVLVTINDVDVTPDLRQAHVFVGMLGDPAAQRKVLVKLQRDAGQLQVKVSKRVVLRYTPRLNFKLDDSVERGVRLLSVIQGIDEEDAAKKVAPEVHVDPDEQQSSTDG